MKLLVLVCLCALAAADEEPHGAPTTPQLAGILTNLYRRFLHTVAPKQLEIQDALHIEKLQGQIAAGPAFRSPVSATFQGIDHDVPTFSYINSMIMPGQKGYFGQWHMHDTSDQLLTYHYGGSVKIHMMTTGGIHKEVILGNPAYHKDHNAKFVVMIPHGTYAIFESLSEEEATFHSYVAIPAWDQEHAHYFTQEEMERKYPAFSELFHELASPEVHHEKGYDENRFDSHQDEEYELSGEGHGPRRFRGRFGGQKKFAKLFH
uniref:Waterborne settlement pheromone-like protein 1 n=1 Tax=Amphibalanus improvisus TaxID=1220549 RepID=A0A4Y5R002_AMPIM|nr:waterborne settlement pheromone-like protein 1 [Amphibalanus improvisus]